MFNRNRDLSQTRQRYSIKKFKFGAASVLVGLSFLGSTSSVMAETPTPSTVIENRGEEKDTDKLAGVADEKSPGGLVTDSSAAKKDEQLESARQSATTVEEIQIAKDSVNNLPASEEKTQLTQDVNGISVVDSPVVTDANNNGVADNEDLEKAREDVDAAKQAAQAAAAKKEKVERDGLVTSADKEAVDALIQDASVPADREVEPKEMSDDTRDEKEFEEEAEVPVTNVTDQTISQINAFIKDVINRPDNTPLLEQFDAVYKTSEDKVEAVKVLLSQVYTPEVVNELTSLAKLNLSKGMSSKEVLTAILAAGVELANNKSRLDGGHVLVATGLRAEDPIQANFVEHFGKIIDSQENKKDFVKTIFEVENALTPEVSNNLINFMNIDFTQASGQEIAAAMYSAVKELQKDPLSFDAPVSTVLASNQLGLGYTGPAVESEVKQDFYYAYVGREYKGNIDDGIRTKVNVVNIDGQGYVEFEHTFNTNFVNRNYQQFFFSVPQSLGTPENWEIKQYNKNHELINTTKTFVNQTSDTPETTGNISGKKIGTGRFIIKDKAQGRGTAGLIANANLFEKVIDKKLAPRDVIEPVLESSQQNYYVIRSHRSTNANSYWKVSYRAKIIDENSSIGYAAGSSILSAGIGDFKELLVGVQGKVEVKTLRNEQEKNKPLEIDDIQNIEINENQTGTADVIANKSIRLENSNIKITNNNQLNGLSANVSDTEISTKKQITFTPSIDDWKDDEIQREFNIEVDINSATRGDDSVAKKNFKVIVKRIHTPAQPTGEATPATVTNGQEVPADTTVLTPGKDTTIKAPATVDGVTVGTDGNLTGTPNVTFDGEDESKEITIPVTLTNGKDEVEQNVTVTVQRDTDGDGDPDVTDTDDDGDGYSDDLEKEKGSNPKDASSTPAQPTGEATPATVTNGQEVPADTTVLTPGKDTTIKAPATVDGVTVGTDGNLTGTPNVTFDGEDESKEITIPVTLTNGKDEVEQNVTVTVQRDTDGDGDPDVTDTDDDGDGYSDDLEKEKGSNPKDASSTPAQPTGEATPATVTNGQEVPAETKTATLPNTGEAASLFTPAALAILAGLGLVAYKKKEEA